MDSHLEKIIRDLRPILLPHFGVAEILHYKDPSQSFSVASAATKLDLQVEEYLAEHLGKMFPGVGFYGEEHGGDNTSETFWLVDPIDGTGNYIHGLPFSTTMIALIDKGEVVSGIIYDFVGDKLYHAEKDKGAFCNNEKIHVGNRPLAGAYMGWETHLEKPENMEVHMKLRARCALFKTVSSGFEHAMVASGKLDGRICFDPYGKMYDFAPGALLIKEAGGVVANIGMTSYDYRNLNFIATNKQIFEGLTSGPDAIFPIMK